MPAGQLMELARGAVAATAHPGSFAGGHAEAYSTQILINDRLDIAVAAGAAGVHLGEDSLPVAAVEAWRQDFIRERGQAGGDFIVGVSCHSTAAAVEAERDGANYVVFGPVFATPSKAEFGLPQGLERLAEVCRAVRIPVLAIGGVARENAAGCFRAGAAGIAAIRLFQECSDIAGLISELRSMP